MKSTAKPMRTTLIFGLSCGLFAVFFAGVARWTFFPYPLFQLLIWTFLAAYGILLARWSRTPLSRIVFPLALPLLLLVAKSPSDMFVLSCLLILSWVRGGVCFPGPLASTLGVELALCFGAAALVAFLSPRSPLAWGLGVWLFFLVQSLYFMFRSRTGKHVDGNCAVDPFEKARKNAEEILDAGGLDG